MNLNSPPPGVGRAPEIVPAMLQARPRPVPAAAPSPASDALTAMLSGSNQWENHPAPVTWTVTITSWLLLVLDIAAIYANRALAGQNHIFARIITWDYHPQAAISLAASAAAAMLATAVTTKGLRQANVTWLRVWGGAAIASALAVAAMFVALIVGLVLLVVGLVVGLAVMAIVIVGGGMLGLAIGQAMAG